MCLLPFFVLSELVAFIRYALEHSPNIFRFKVIRGN